MILAIDPGTYQSGFVVTHNQIGLPDCPDRPIKNFGTIPNDELARLMIDVEPDELLAIVIEDFQNYDNPVGKDCVKTIRWSGRFEQIAQQFLGVEPCFIYRSTIRMTLCGAMRGVGDPAVRTAIVDMFGGQQAGIGLKASPGPLHGIAKHQWSALAVAITWNLRYRVETSQPLQAAV